MMDEKDIARQGAQGDAHARATRAGVSKSSHGIDALDFRALRARVSNPSHGGTFAMVAMSCFVAALAAFIALAGCSGCSREAEPAKAKPSFDRTKDPEYQKEMDGLLKQQAEITKRASAIERELAEARAADPNSAKTKELEKMQKAVTEELENHRARSLLAIREWKQKEQTVSEKSEGGK